MRVVRLSRENCALLVQSDNTVVTFVRSPSWSWFLPKTHFPENTLDYSDYRDLPREMEECCLADWELDNINSNEYQCYYSTISYEYNNSMKIMTLLRLEEKNE